MFGAACAPCNAVIPCPTVPAPTPVWPACVIAACSIPDIGATCIAGNDTGCAANLAA